MIFFIGTKRSFSDFDSEPETEIEYEPESRYKRQRVLAEDELDARPSMGYGQRPWPTPRLQHTRRPRYRMSAPSMRISTARHLVEQGYDVTSTSFPHRHLVAEALAAGERHEQEERIASQPVAAPAAPVSPASASANPVRPSAEEAFPGELPADKKALHWDRKERVEGMVGHYNKLQFKRELYKDGFEIADLENKSSIELANMWTQRRDERDTELADAVLGEEPAMSENTPEIHEGAITEEPLLEAANVNVDSGLRPQTSGPTSAADHEDATAPMDPNFPVPSASQPANNNPLPGNSNQVVDHAAPATNASASAMGVATTNTATSTGQTNAPKTGAAKTKATAKKEVGKNKKTGVNAEETKRLKTLAARVGRYPLSLPGNNKGQALRMQADWSVKTIKQKYNRHQMIQLLTDYNALPKEWENCDGTELAEAIEAHRRQLAENDAQLQDAWDTRRLEQYVAAQEAIGAIPPAPPTSRAAPASGNVVQLPPSQQLPQSQQLPHSQLPKRKTRNKTTTRSKKRSHEEDLSEVFIQQPPQKMAKTTESAEASQQDAYLPCSEAGANSPHLPTHHENPLQYPQMDPSAYQEFAPGTLHHQARNEPLQQQNPQRSDHALQSPSMGIGDWGVDEQLPAQIIRPLYGQPANEVPFGLTYTPQPQSYADANAFFPPSEGGSQFVRDYTYHRYSQSYAGLPVAQNGNSFFPSPEDGIQFRQDYTHPNHHASYSAAENGYNSFFPFPANGTQFEQNHTQSHNSAAHSTAENGYGWYLSPAPNELEFGQGYTQPENYAESPAVEERYNPYFLPSAEVPQSAYMVPSDPGQAEQANGSTDLDPPIDPSLF